MRDSDMEETVRKVLADWPLYSSADHVQASEFRPDRWAIGYCSDFIGRPFTRDMNTAEIRPHTLDVQIEKPIFYLLSIEISPAARGKGYGQALYELCERLAKTLGCTQIRQMPSGNAGDGTRREYLIRRGWIPDGIEVFKTIEQ